MKHLNQYITERYHQIEVFEGGASGHMLHPFDVDEFTCGDIEELIRSMFGGKIEGMTEKMDGFGMQASMNRQGDVVFIRNKGDLNNERGGMMIDEFQSKWKENPTALTNYTKGGKIIEAVFKKIGKDFFNPKEGIRVVANCECIIEGTTNTIPYASDQVDFHNLWIYEWNGTEWVNKEITKKGLDILEKACEGIDNAKITPNVIIKYTEDAQKLEKKWLDKWNEFLNKHKCSTEMTIEAIKFNLFYEYVQKHYPWILDDSKGSQMLCDRWLFGKKEDWKNTKAIYKDHENELNAIDKKSSKFVGDVLEPLQMFFYSMGADLIKITDGFINKGQDQTVKKLLSDLKIATDKIKKEGSLEDNEYLQKWLNVLKEIGEENLSSAEGIVFTYKGKMMKWTGGFVPLNKIIGYSKYSMSPKTLTESLFDDNIKSNIKINGVEIYEPDWKLCEEFFQKKRKNQFNNISRLYIGDSNKMFDVIYNEDDCVICLHDLHDIPGLIDIYVLCPETIYMNYQVEKITSRGKEPELDEYDICKKESEFNICFLYSAAKFNNKILGEWTHLAACDNNYSDSKKVKDELGFNTGYIPKTISNKAKNILKKYL